MSVDSKDIFVLSFTEVYPPDISTGSRMVRPEPASTVKSFNRALIQESFSLEAYLFKYIEEANRSSFSQKNSYNFFLQFFLKESAKRRD